MRRELVTVDELMGELRLQGISEIGEVKAAYIEGDGRISIIGREGSGHGKSERRET